MSGLSSAWGVPLTQNVPSDVRPNIVIKPKGSVYLIVTLVTDL